jgi:uncharacterized RDD family membrane protein YckC
MANVPAPLPPLALEATEPQSPIEIAPEIEVPVHVPSWLRLASGRLIDALLVAVVGIAAIYTEALVTGVDIRISNRQWLDQVAEWLSLYNRLVRHGALAGAGFACLYSLLCALIGGQTLGRRLTDTVLVRMSTRGFYPLVALGRALMAILSALPFGAGYFWLIVDPYHRTWHDMLAGTVVVRRHVPLGDKS